MRSYNLGDTVVADSLFDLAVEHARNARQRGLFFAKRISRGYGDEQALVLECLRRVPGNEDCLFLEAGLKGDAARAAAGNTVEGRAAYWCMADIYRNVAAVTSDHVASSARRMASQYERASPTREQYTFETDWRVGDSVTASLGKYGDCITTVR